MKIKRKLELKNIFKILNYTFFTISILTMIVLVNFVKNNVYKPITINNDNLNIQIDLLSGRVNKIKFDKIIKNQEEKENIISNTTKLKNVFK